MKELPCAQSPLAASWSSRFLLTCLLGASVFAGTAAAQDGPARYDGHKVVRAEIANERDLQTMLRLSDDVWSEHIGIGPADFRLPPESMADLAAARMAYEVLIEDVQSLIDAERTRLASPVQGAGWYDDYKDLDAINARMDALAAQRPDLAEGFTVGTSIEGRPIKGLRISNDAAFPGRRKAGMVFGATQHAREWIAPMVTMYLAEALVTRYDTDPAIKRFVDRIEFFIVPVVNPDGYVYTWTTDRLWRKNRRDIAGSSLLRHRSQPELGLPMGPAERLERRPVQRPLPGDGGLLRARDRGDARFHRRPSVGALRARHAQLRAAPAPALGLHAAPPPRHETYEALGAAMAQLIHAVHGRTYVHGPTYTTLYPVSGGITDWAWAPNRPTALSSSCAEPASSCRPIRSSPTPRRSYPRRSTSPPGSSIPSTSAPPATENGCPCRPGETAASSGRTAPPRV